MVQIMSASSRFLHLGAALVRARAPTPTPSSLFPPVCFLKPLNPSLLPLHGLSSSSSAAVETFTADNNTETPASDHHHPWPEWVNFVDSLKTKGYIIQSPKDENETATAAAEAAAAADSSSIDYLDRNMLKEACVSFARDRYDVFKSLSIKEIRNVVKGGCPNIFRKAVNSAKRLRVYVGLEEADVCGACNLQSSCDRAYVLVKEFEADARTVDVVRILLLYALDPLVISGEEKLPRRELVKSSARKLLSELIELSETPPPPALPKPASKTPVQQKQTTNLIDGRSENGEMNRRDWACPKCNFKNFSRNQKCLRCNAKGPKRVGLNDVEMKKGDWICSQCNFTNFSRNAQCRNCKAEGPKRVGVNEVEMKKGDWNCPQCNFMNFSRNAQCRNCKAEGPKRVGVNEVAMKAGDWNCPQCSFMNFASNKQCLRCQEPRPKRQLNPGEWECPSCDFLNYRRNMVCLKCNHECPSKEVANVYEEQIWKRPQ